MPKTDGELVRCAYESLVLKYRELLGSLEELTGEKIEVMHIVGDGSQNKLLNQFTAGACQPPVLAGPVEATALGNLLAQICADGEVGSVAEMRSLDHRSIEVKTFRFEPKLDWESAACKFESLRA